MRFKVCCIQSVEEAERAILAGAWAIGLVAAMPSGPGPLGNDKIRAIADATQGRIKRFLLTSNTKAPDVVAHINACGCDGVQLVDAVDNDVYASIRTACPGVEIVQVIHVQDDRAMDQAKAVARSCDKILLDSGRTDGPLKELGGTGRTHNWEISARIVQALNMPVILAGGLNPQNALQACQRVKPYALDVCSGLRGEGFSLAQEKLNAFAQAISANF
jgi:phosphoribosylanthranilate isomerase